MICSFAKFLFIVCKKKGYFIKKYSFRYGLEIWNLIRDVLNWEHRMKMQKTVEKRYMIRVS